MKKTMMVAAVLAGTFAAAAMSEGKPLSVEHGCSNAATAFNVAMQARAQNIPIYTLLDKIEASGAHKALVPIINIAYSGPYQWVATKHARAELANAYYLECVKEAAK